MIHTQSTRINRVAQLIQRQLAQLIPREVRDPRLQSMVTVSGVEVARNLSFAKVFFTVFQGDPEQVSAILNAASGFLRGRLAKQLELRTMPELRFVYDSTIVEANHLSRLIDEVN